MPDVVTHFMQRQTANRDMRTLCGRTILEAGADEYVTSDDRLVTCVLCLEALDAMERVMCDDNA